MRRTRSFNRRRRGQLEFLWPFLLIILGGIILILLVQLFWSWLDQREAEFKNKVYFYLDEGQSEILPWGESEWASLYHNQLVLEGDRFEMASGSRGLLSFYNGTSVRLDANTDLEIDTLTSKDEEDTIVLKLRDGRIWSSVLAGDQSQLVFKVETEHLRVTSYGTRFEVGMTDRETVRVLEDQVLVEFLDRSGSREVVLDQLTVGVGQQIELTANDYELMLAHQSLSLLEALGDSWKTTDWYVWNMSEDLDPTDYTGMQPTEISTDVITETVTVDEDLPEDDSLEPIENDDDDSVAPTLSRTFPTETPYDLPSGETSVAITGTTSNNTIKIVVTSYDASGNPIPYTLSQYTAGSTTWRYNAAEVYGNLREGRNLFTVVAQNTSGVKSDPLEVLIQVEEGAFTENTDADTTEESANDVESTSTTETTEETETAESTEPTESATTTTETTDDITPPDAPQVTSLNGDSLPADGVYTTSSDSVTMVGVVSSDTTIVTVNDFQLTQYVAGSGTWTYYAKSDFQNFDVGTNTYVVVAKDAAGNTSRFTFQIYREAP